MLQAIGKDPSQVRAEIARAAHDSHITWTSLASCFPLHQSQKRSNFTAQYEDSSLQAMYAIWKNQAVFLLQHVVRMGT